MDFLKAFTTTFLIVIAISVANGQQTNQGHNEQVTIVGSYDPSINAAFKINTKPQLKEIEFKSQEFSFNFMDVKQTTAIEINPIKVVALRTSEKVQKYDNFLKAGLGSRISPYVDFYHSTVDKGNYSFNANIFHYSSFNNIKDYSASPFSKTHAKINLTKFIDKHVLDLGFKYGINTNRFYGYKPDEWLAIDIPKDELKQMFNLIRANAVVRSAFKGSSKLHHEIGFNTYYYFDKFKTSELDVRINFDLHKGFDVVEMLDYQNAGIQGSFDFYSNNDSINSNTEFYVNVKPYFTAKYGAFSFNAGLNFGYLSDTSSSFHFWPVIDVSMNVLPGSFTIFAGINGKLEKQSYLTLTTENPYLSPMSTLGWLNEKVNVYGGFRASFAQIVGVDVKIGWKSFENMAFFINEADYNLPFPSQIGPLNKFKTTFDDGNVFYADAEVSLNIGKEFKLWLGGNYNSYSLDSLAQPYHKPLSTARLGASYLLASKLKISTEIMLNGKRYAIDNNNINPKEIELKSYLDLNIGLEYKINDKLSAFLNGTNILNKNYDQFYSYPVQGIQFMGGIVYRF